MFITSIVALGADLVATGFYCGLRLLLHQLDERFHIALSIGGLRGLGLRRAILVERGGMTEVLGLLGGASPVFPEGAEAGGGGGEGEFWVCLLEAVAEASIHNGMIHK